MDLDHIVVRGAREHNLKNITLKIPRNKLSVITGLSGSGKSSLAFDTIYAEGQRRYVDSLSTYARQFLEKLKKPEVDSISGLSPAIAIDQKSVGLNPRSTVGTVTEIYDYLRLLFARVGEARCPTHHIPVTGRNPDQIINEILSRKPGHKLILLAPVVQGKKGEFSQEIQKWIKQGYIQARIDGELLELTSVKKLAKTKVHEIDLVIDKLIIKPGLQTRVAESVHAALRLGGGSLAIFENDTRTQLSITAACPECGFSFPELEPRFFSFNNPRGACTTCHGLGTVDIEEVERNDYGGPDAHNSFRSVSYRIADRLKRASDAEDGDDGIDQMAVRPCPDCQGDRLREEARNVFVSGRTITELSALPAEDLLQLFESTKWAPKQSPVAEKIMLQIQDRLRYLTRVGAGYLSLNRPTRTLSGGENQRIRLASQVGSALVGILYVLDEPSIGLHPRDHHRLLSILRELRDLGNTILLVEHDEDTIRTADHVIDIGPRAGKGGGQVIAEGTPQEIASSPTSTTGLYLSGRKRIPVPNTRRKGSGQKLRIRGATGNNLRDLDVSLPLGCLISVTGVSGSGKSTLIMDTLYRALANKFYRAQWTVSPHKEISGIEHLDKVIDINQNPIGRTPRSTPATYTGLFPLIRDLFASLPDSKVRGYAPGRFSFNVKGGRCEACQGAGQVRVEMHFLSDVFVECDTCRGLRYNKETLAIQYKGRSIASVLNMTVAEALPFFENHAAIRRKLETLSQVGLDYISLGQNSTTLSGGEAQRVKLSKELSKRGTGRTLYILDEPTTGLHFDDIAKLVELLHRLVDQGNTVLVIEHNMDVVKASDWVIDLGPDGGSRGGQLVAEGPPEVVGKSKQSETARFLKPLLEA
ncbi:MAG TPA: excinuclease ABC subunit UvrA [Pseudobdellovibrionaceae bacterium]|nr:excinuclease ABC subunit UvrA [Pseudobdellovibrionaceae bacterium]